MNEYELNDECGLGCEIDEDCGLMDDYQLEFDYD
jgi:hypothetical protein